MSEPDLAGKKAGRDAYKCSGDHITDEMPVTHDKQHCRNEQQYGKRQDADAIEAHENTGEGAGDNHVAGGKAAVGRAAEEVESMLSSVQNGGSARYPEN